MTTPIDDTERPDAAGAGAVGDADVDADVDADADDTKVEAVAPVAGRR